MPNLDLTKFKPTESQGSLDLSTFKPTGGTQTDPSIGEMIGNNVKDAVGGLKTLYGGSEQGIANKLKTDITEGASDIQKGGLGNLVKGTTKTGFRVAGDVAGAVYAPIGAALQASGINHIFDYLGELSQKGGKYNPINVITDSKAVQQFVEQHPNLGEDFGRALNLGFASAETGKIDPKTVVPRTIEQFRNIENTPANVADKVATIVTNKAKDVFTKPPEKVVQDRVNTLEKISDNYASLRKQADFNPDAAKESVKRVAQTDVLSGAVDENGLIRTNQPGGAVDQYEAQTIGHAEDVVKRNLDRLKENVTPEEIETRLTEAVKSSGLEGVDLNVALKKIRREVEGYKLRANEDGTIPLSVIQDAKVGKYKNTNFNTPAEIQTYNKAIGRGLKETIEKNSTFNVKDVNTELGKYLKDIEFLKSLDGKRVKGGKLGKYFAQVTGNIAGGAAGALVGGPFGAAAGSVIGGEVAGAIKGRGFQKTFGKQTGLVAPKNPIIDKAVQSTQTPTAVTPSLPIDSSGNVIPSEPMSLKENLKKGILQTAAEKYKNIPSKEGGFVRIGGKEFREIKEATKREMILVIDYLNLRKTTDNKSERILSDLTNKYNINSDWSNNKIADTFEKLIENTKTAN